MYVEPIKSPTIHANNGPIEQVLENVLPPLADGIVVVLSSKIVALCEGAVVPVDGNDREVLIREQSDLYLDPALSKYGHHFTIKNKTLVSSAGIDESNADGHYVLWPRDVQASANRLRAWLQQRYGIEHVGVLITDSTSYPLRRGTVGVALAHSGFEAVKSYIGERDLFGRELQLETANIAGGLAATAVMAMGEGSESTPFVVIRDIPTITFIADDPSQEELQNTYLSLEEDLFEPFLGPAPWRSDKR